MTDALAVDLDGTLLHAEPAEIAVWGSSGPRYLSAAAAEKLEALSRMLPVIIATGRNARSVSGLTDQLDASFFSGFVLENGMIARTHLLPAEDETPLAGIRPWEALKEKLAASFPGSSHLKNYEQCLAMRVPSEAQPGPTVRTAMNQLDMNAHVYLEPGKIFVYPRPASKLEGIHALNFRPFLALGDGTNDLDMLKAAAYSGTPSSAHEKAVRLVREKEGGFCTKKKSHEGAEALLDWACEKVREAAPSAPRSTSFGDH